MSDDMWMEITVAEAAQRLGVSHRQVQRLAEEGQIQVVRRLGRVLLLDDLAVRALTVQQRQPGRRWSAKTAWAAIDLLATGTTDRASGSTLSRLRRRLVGLSAQDFVRLASGRARSLRFEQLVGDESDLADWVVFTGQSALRDSEAARRFGLAAGPGSLAEGYLKSDDVDALGSDVGLVESAEGRVLLHVTDYQPVVTQVTVALDLATFGATRERAAGLRVLSETLAAQ